jgi:hypothetical protein
MRKKCIERRWPRSAKRIERNEEFKTFKQLVLGKSRARCLQAWVDYQEAKRMYDSCYVAMGAEKLNEFRPGKELRNKLADLLIAHEVLIEARIKHSKAVVKFGKTNGGRRV